MHVYEYKKRIHKKDFKYAKKRQNQTDYNLDLH